MRELIYFSEYRLLIEVVYNHDLNMLRYETHRKPTPEEKKFVEIFLISKFAQDTDYFNETDSHLVFSGINPLLKMKLSQMEYESYLKASNSHGVDLKTQVSELVNSSLKNFYFERLGDSILELRKKVKKGNGEKEIIVEKLKHNILELIEAYNKYSDTKVTVDKAVPRDLLGYFNSDLQT